MGRTLREVRDEDLPLLFEQWADPVAVQMAAFTAPDHMTGTHSSAAGRGYEPSTALNLSGSQKFTVNSDGSASFSTTGGTVFIPPFGGVSTLTLLKGSYAESFDSQGNLVSARIAGTSTDLCAVLGP